MGEIGPGADWRDAEAYAPLLGADRSIFAWEWLRRDPDYRAAAEEAREGGGGAGASAKAARWGLHRFEAPRLGAPEARPFWRADQHRLVLRAWAEPAAGAADAVELLCIPGASSFDAEQGEGWLFSDGLRAVRLDLVRGTGRRGPVNLHYLLSGLAGAQGPLLALRRLLSLAETKRFSRGLHRPEPQARRWILVLRAHDSLSAGMSQREAAAELLSAAAGEARWRVNSGSVRSQIQRLCRAARVLAAGGWRSFLD